MAFNLPKVLKALLFSTSQPLAIKDIQAAFTRFHEQASAANEPAEDGAAEASRAGNDGDAAADASDAGGLNGNEAIDGATVESPGASAGEALEVAAEAAEDPELYQDVPSLITATQIREAMDVIAAELRARDDGLLLIEGSSGYRLVTHPRVARWVRILRQEPPPLKLSQSAIETLAIIAYRQPTTRTEIETIRGVSAEAGLNKLIERELIYIVGRADLPGRPIQYGTTDQFLEFIGIRSLDELPASDVLSSRQVDEWLQRTTQGPKPGDAEMGLAQENLPLHAETDAAADENAASDDNDTAGDDATAEPEISPAEPGDDASATDEPTA